ncbi:MAG: phage holin family protein [Microbacteriaceae bacterium]
MPEKDPTNWTAATWILASGMAFGGGFINWYSKVRSGHTRVFNVAELFGEMLISGVVGLGSYMAGDGLSLPPSLCAVAAGIGGHMGTRLVFLAEELARKKFEEIGK